MAIFDDGEPIDPLKLQSLQDQIIKLQAESALQSIATTGLSSSLSKIIYHSKSGSVDVSNLKAKIISTPVPIDIKWSDDYDASSIKTVVTLRSKRPDLDIRYSLSGTISAPTLLVYSTETYSGTLNFEWISVAGKISKA